MWLNIRHRFSVLRELNGLVAANHRTQDTAGVSA
jgi:hypothetical protein